MKKIETPKTEKTKSYNIIKNFVLTQNIAQALDRRAFKEGISASELARRIFIEYLTEEENK